QIYPGRADGTYADMVPLAGGLFIHGGIVADFNGDGRKDLAIANHYGRSVTIFLNQGAFNFLATDVPVGMQANDVTAGDLRGDGTFAAASSFSIGNQADLDGAADRNHVVSLKTSDLNGDHATDLIVSDGTVFLNRAVDPNWAPVVDLSESSATSDAVLLRAKVTDDDQDMVTYTWTSNDGIQIGPVPNPCFGSWATPGTHTYTVTVDDGHGHQVSASVSFTVGSGGGSGPALSM